MQKPILNITMPVWNRFYLTQKAIISLKKAKNSIPYVLTVVDNGSSEEMQKRLIEFKETGLIDNLFLLKKNYGISCACNIGWKMVDAPFYMKLDNDVMAVPPDPLGRLFAIWKHCKELSTIGAALNNEQIYKDPKRIQTPQGDFGICTSNLIGYSIIIPKKVSDILGYWNEDYHLYGGEDGDYGLRMRCAGFPQYYYEKDAFFRHEGTGENGGYTDLDKGKEHRDLFCDSAGGIGLFTINEILYTLCIRYWRVPQRYRIRDVDGYYVEVEEDPAYEPVRDALQKSKKIIDRIFRDTVGGLHFYKVTPEDQRALLEIWKVSPAGAIFTNRSIPGERSDD